MKKFVSIVLLIALALSCWACDKKQDTPQAEAPLDPKSPQALYGHIDQNVLTDGVYKIWNAEGVKSMASHPEGSFEILCDIDMGGAVLQPLGTEAKPFSGTLNGANFVISNFTVEGTDSCLGFVVRQ